MIYNISVSEPWFTLIKMGLKSREGRLNKTKFAKLKVNDIVIWTYKNKSCKTKIVNINKYDSFRDMIKKETLKRTLPGVPTIDCGVEVYRQYYSEELEKKFGVLAIELKRI